MENVTRRRQVEFWMAEHQRLPTIDEVLEITGLKCRKTAGRLRKEVCMELPKVEWEDVWELVKSNIKDKLDDKDVSVANLIQMLPFITPKKTDIKTDSNVEFKITIQKPDDVDE